jgi:hypothetical protein
MLAAGRAGTVALCVATGVGVIRVDPWGVVAQIVALVLFAAGCVAFVRAYALAVRRSRREQVATLAVFVQMPGAPPALRTEFRVATVLQFAAGLTGASLRPFSALAFGILAGVYGLGLTGLWGATYGVFPRRNPSAERKRHG